MKTVTYYTHEGSDASHSTRDNVALVLAEDEEAGWMDLAIFPVGGPVTFQRAYAWDEDASLPPPGGNYWREEGSDPPDFEKAYRHYNNQDFQHLLRQQQQKLQVTPTKEHEALIAAQREEQEKLMSELDGDQKPEGKQKPEGDADQLARNAEQERQKEAAQQAERNRRAMEGRRDA